MISGGWGGVDLCNYVLSHYTFGEGFIGMSHPAYQPSWFTGFLLVSYSSSTPSCPDNTCTNSSIHCAPSHHWAKTVWQSQELEPFVLHFLLRLELRRWWQVTQHSGVQNSTFNTTVSSGRVQSVEKPSRWPWSLLCHALRPSLKDLIMPGSRNPTTIIVKSPEAE